MPARKKSNTNFVAQEPRQGWAYFEEPGEDRGKWRRTPYPWGAPKDHFPREYGDWFAVSKPKSWRPPAGTLAGESLLGAGGASLELFAPDKDAEAGAGAGGGHTKIGAGRKPQAYDEHGRYTGPGGGAVSLRTGEIRMHMTDEPGAEDTDEDTGVGEDATADSSDNGEDGLELTDILLADSGRGDADEEGGLSGGAEVRGKVIPPPPPAPEEPHLTYSIGQGALRDPQARVMTDKGYSGLGKDENKASRQHVENQGPIPEGNWRIREIRDSTYRTDLSRPVYRLEPDSETRERVTAMGRKPDTFLLHGDNTTHTASTGCIIVDRQTREQLKQHAGGWIRVTK